MLPQGFTGGNLVAGIDFESGELLFTKIGDKKPWKNTRQRQRANGNVLCRDEIDTRIKQPQSIKTTT